MSDREIDSGPVLSPEETKELAKLKKRFPNTTFTYVGTLTGARALYVVGRRRGQHD